MPHAKDSSITHALKWMVYGV